MPLRKYVSHKLVEAGVIYGWQSSYVDGCFVEVAIDIEAITNNVVERIAVPDDFFARGTPKKGDYFVRYADGYVSWSPKNAFQEGYTEAPAA